ncbi:fimbrial protein [Escherichia coli]
MITYTGYKLKVIFIIFLFLGYHVVAYAEMGRDREFCYPGSPENNTTPAVFYYNFGTTIISDINNNIPGTILPEKNWKIGLYKAYCNSISNYEVYFSGVSGIDPSGTSGIQQGSDIFVPVTHEISISTHIKLYNKNGTQTDKTVPFYNYSTNYPTDRSKPSNWSSGTEGYIKIKLDKKIISDISLNNVLLVSLYASQRQTEHGPVPLFNAWISNLDIQVPQGCTINEGTSFTVNMPDVWASELSRAGAGAKPAGVTPVATTIPINCMNKDTDAVMTLVFDGNISATRDTNGKQSIIQAQDNPDVGIMIMDSQQNSVDLNALATSVGVPFRLVENQAASAQTADVTFLTLPVSTTGKVPAAGRYNALAILRVEYQ